MKAKTRNMRRSSFASGGVADTGKVSKLLDNEGDVEAARRPGKPSLVLDEIERLPCGGPRTTASAAGRRHNEGVIKWNKILRNLASRNAGRVILWTLNTS